MALNVFLSYLLHVVLTAGLICTFGGVVAVCNKFFYSSLGSNSKVVCYITGFIGTPIHELSHALMCIIFFHKITEIKLFQVNSDDGVLGYVNHSYNPKNPYHQVGNFFIGIAPVLVGFLLLTVIFYLLLPHKFEMCMQNITNINWTNGLRGLFGTLGNLFAILIDCFTTWQWWLFLLIGSFIALHMTLSKADWKGALSGIIFYLIIFAIIDIVIAVINMDIFNDMTGKLFLFAVFVLFFGIAFLLIILVLTVIGVIIGKISRR